MFLFQISKGKLCDKNIINLKEGKKGEDKIWKKGSTNSTNDVGDTHANLSVFTISGNELNVPDKTVSLN